MAVQTCSSTLDYEERAKMPTHESTQAQSTTRRRLLRTAEDNYASQEGWTLQREYGVTPNGNPIGGRWVLRKPEGIWVDVDQSRHDLAERNKLTLG